MKQKEFFYFILAPILSLIVFYILAQTIGGYLCMIDIELYMRYAREIVDHGGIPFITMNIEYPLLSVAYFLVPYIISKYAGVPDAYLPVHIVLMFVCYAATMVLTYLITQRLFKNEKRSAIALFMCALSMQAVYFAMFRYDALPALITMLSIYLFINAKQTSAYVTTAIGFLVKWFSAVLIPFYIIYNIKNQKSSIRNIVIFSVIVAVFSIPFMIWNFGGFLYPYIFHFTRPAQAEGLFFLLDTALGTTPLFSNISGIILASALLGVVYGYYRNGSAAKGCLVRHIAIAMFVFVLFNKVASPQYILWITPLMAIYMSKDIGGILKFAALQVVAYIQFPLLINIIYDPTHYYNVRASIIFFAIKFIIWFIVLEYLMSYREEKENIISV